jgi:hypothetical protein
MRSSEPSAEMVVGSELTGINRSREFAPHRGWDHVGRERGQRVRDRLWIPRGPEDAVHPPGPDRGEEVLEVEPHDNKPAHMGAGVRANRAAAPEAVSGVVYGNPVEHFVQ